MGHKRGARHPERRGLAAGTGYRCCENQIYQYHLGADPSQVTTSLFQQVLRQDLDQCHGSSPE